MGGGPKEETYPSSCLRQRRAAGGCFTLTSCRQAVPRRPPTASPCPPPGVADQLQTNYASDLRSILKTLFEVMATKPEMDDQDKLRKGECPPTGPAACSPGPSAPKPHSRPGRDGPSICPAGPGDGAWTQPSLLFQ